MQLEQHWINGSQLTDEQLVGLIAGGDAQSFNALFERYYQQIYNFAKKQLPAKESIEDVVQEVFLRVFKSAKNFDTERKFSSWLYRIALNEIKRHWKRSSARQTFSLNTPLGDEAGDGERQDYLADERPGTAEVVESELFSRDLRNLFDRLPEKQRTVVLLKVYQGLTFEQISEVCACPLSTVLSRMRYSVTKLRHWLGLDEQGKAVPSAADSRRSTLGDAPGAVPYLSAPLSQPTLPATSLAFLRVRAAKTAPRRVSPPLLLAGA